ncbi:unnamed protein product [Cochlearia groenlandica]
MSFSQCIMCISGTWSYDELKGNKSGAQGSLKETKKKKKRTQRSPPPEHTTEEGTEDEKTAKLADVGLGGHETA